MTPQTRPRHRARFPHDTRPVWRHTRWLHGAGPRAQVLHLLRRCAQANSRPSPRPLWQLWAPAPPAALLLRRTSVREAVHSGAVGMVAAWRCSPRPLTQPWGLTPRASALRSHRQVAAVRVQGFPASPAGARTGSGTFATCVTGVGLPYASGAWLVTWSAWTSARRAASSWLGAAAPRPASLQCCLPLSSCGRLQGLGSEPSRWLSLTGSCPGDATVRRALRHGCLASGI